ncbi:putative transcriptional regulator, TetR family protein [Actinomycetota bacterium]|nr:putative transcriptional regulator, TetR family protein [Actinomycetota bacterium]
MNRMPVAARRAQLIEAAITVATKDGIDAATVRAVAAQAGVSLGVVHYCFQDKDELLRAVAGAITQLNVSATQTERTGSGSAETVIRLAVGDLWAGIRHNRGAQLLSFELTTSALRHVELSQVAIEQYRGSWEAARRFVDDVARRADIEWTVPRDELARMIIAVIDGLSLAWLVDGDDAASLAGLHHFAGYLLTMVRPAGSTPLPTPTPLPAPASLPAAHRAVSRPSFGEPRPRTGADATVGALTSS